MRKISANFVLTVIATVISVFGLELMVRLVFPEYTPVRGEKLIYHEGVVLGQPNVTVMQYNAAGEFNVPITYNSYGFRDKKELDEATNNDLFIVGDSFTNGHGVRVERRFSNILEEKMNDPVYNLGIGNSDLEDYLNRILFVERQGINIGKLLVVICMENDIRDYSRTNEIGQKPPFGSIKNLLYENSAIYRFTTYAVKNFYVTKQAALAMNLFERDHSVSDVVPSNGPLASSADKISELAHYDLIGVVIIPHRGLWVGDLESREHFSSMHQTFVRLLTERKLPIIDLRPYFEQEGDPLRYYFEYDGHWNELGHKLAAKVIGEHLGMQ